MNTDLLRYSCETEEKLSSGISNENQTALVSVVITTRNEKNTIQGCIISIFEQSYPNFEIILVDAKSSDGTIEEAERLEEASKSFKNCKRYLLLSEENADSPAKGRNIGAKAAQGIIIAFIDGDCIAENDWLVNLVKYIPKEMGIVGGPNVLRHFRRSSVLEAIDDVLGTYLGSGGSPQFIKIERVTEAYPIPACNLAIQKSLFDSVGGFDESLRHNEDTKLSNMRIQILKVYLQIWNRKR